MRVTGPADRLAVVCVNGGQASEVEGTWSASLEWLVRQLAPQFPELGFAEVRYRIKSWKRLDSCVADARAAVEATAAPRTLLLGFSMGGAVAAQAAAWSQGEAPGRNQRKPEKPAVPADEVEAGAHQLCAVPEAHCHAD